MFILGPFSPLHYSSGTGAGGVTPQVARRLSDQDRMKRILSEVSPQSSECLED